MSATCSICQSLHDRLRPNGRPQSYCHSCHAAHMRKTRPKHSELSEEARAKSSARAYANVYQKRGKLKKRPCADCGSRQVEKHHTDYSKPLKVTWLCRSCHLDLHHQHTRPAQRRAA